MIIDEAHHATATSYQRLLAHFTCKVLGVTATPDRADEDNISDVFETVADEMTIWEAMTAPSPGPYLCRLLFAPCEIDIDLRELSTKDGDFTNEDLADRISPHIEVLANAIRQETGERKTLVFTPTVKVAMGLATALSDSLGLSADWVSGDCIDRDARVEKYKNGMTRILVNCNLLTEGFDDP
jgi:superfamily II DNA or RNA helicase